MCTGRCCSVLNAARTLRPVTFRRSFPRGKRCGRRSRSAVEVQDHGGAMVPASAQDVVWIGDSSVGLQWDPPSANVETVLNDLHSFTLGRDSAVLTTARFGLDSPGFESECGRHFPHQYTPTRYSPSLLYNGYRVLSRDKAAGAWRYNPPQSSAGVEERV
jgi:hypothetical protein